MPTESCSLLPVSRRPETTHGGGFSWTWCWWPWAVSLIAWVLHGSIRKMVMKMPQNRKVDARTLESLPGVWRVHNFIFPAKRISCKTVEVNLIAKCVKTDNTAIFQNWWSVGCHCPRHCPECLAFVSSCMSQWLSLSLDVFLNLVLIHQRYHVPSTCPCLYCLWC